METGAERSSRLKGLDTREMRGAGEGSLHWAMSRAQKIPTFPTLSAPLVQANNLMYSLNFKQCATRRKPTGRRIFVVFSISLARLQQDLLHRHLAPNKLRWRGHTVIFKWHCSISKTPEKYYRLKIC